jgi:hypothetical protein
LAPASVWLGNCEARAISDKNPTTTVYSFCGLHLPALLLLICWDGARRWLRRRQRGTFGRRCGSRDRASKSRSVCAVSGPNLCPFDRSHKLASHRRLRLWLRSCLAGFRRWGLSEGGS